MTLSIKDLARTITKARHDWSREARNAYYEHVRDNCGGWTHFANTHCARSGWEHEKEFHASRASAP
ncbi:hypothetical protein [Mesorhizobium sp.]|uniref:hypothetical protein n=1 Tax=Mesorhizobium sp. TaxID=1871066 RepID=UPI000FEA4496|nr:hypothetical protein [Mesorhizobium sp.]RWO20625.1 MAG: hypothetical protein EOS09_26245 [Mesorhizobium sp.]